MIGLSWIQSSSVALTMVVVTTASIYVALMICVRLAGLRSFSKMSGFDFTITVAIGSLVATVLLAENPPLLQGITGLLALFSIQFFVSYLRTRSEGFANVVDNDAILLMAGTDILHDNLEATRVTVNDLRAKLREANVVHPEQVRAVVMETTGDISVLHADPGATDLDLDLFQDVRGADALEELPHVTRTEGLNHRE